MTHSTRSKTLEQTIAAIQALDLTAIKFKACRKEDGYGWSAGYADQMEVAYKHYLMLHAKHPDLTLAPDQEVDRFWHMHILDTRKYAADCEATFGYFLHHFPYLGLRGEEDAEALQAAFSEMQRLSAQEFGGPASASRHESGKPSAAWCSLESGKASAAWCSLESGKPSAAWCSLESGKASAAWCSLESGKPSAAWCSLESGKASAAWCSLESGKPSAAWCSLESGITAGSAFAAGSSVKRGASESP